MKLIFMLVIIMILFFYSIDVNDILWEVMDMMEK